MDSPNPALMRLYGTEDIYLAKIAGYDLSALPEDVARCVKVADAVPLLARLGMSVLNFELANSQHKADTAQSVEDAQQFEAKREFELAKMHQATDPMRQGEDYYVDHGMTRLASIAAGIGADMAKEGGIGDFATLAKTMGSKVLGAAKGLGGAVLRAPAAVAGGIGTVGGKALSGVGWKGQLALAGGTAAALYGGSKLINKADQAMRSEPAGPATYGGQVRGMGYSLPYGVNSYGVPQVGTSLG